MKISARLNHLFEHIISNHKQTKYEEFWDLCCDHGLLGMQIFKHTKDAPIHLLDQVPKILDVLENKYSQYNDGRIQFRMQDAKTIQLDTKKRHCLIIAGVGGETLLEILAAIIKNNPNAKMDFALSPNSHIFEVRTYLQKHFILKDEALIKDANRYHEHLFIQFSPNCESNITLTGEKIWKTPKLAKPYQKKLIRHYGLISAFRDHPISKQALDAYSNLAL